MLRSLYFIKPSRPYNPGEVAGFEKEVADNLVAMGAAIPIEEKEAFVKEQTEAAKKLPVKKPAKKSVRKSK